MDMQSTSYSNQAAVEQPSAATQAIERIRRLKENFGAISAELFTTLLSIRLEPRGVSITAALKDDPPCPDGFFNLLEAELTVLESIEKTLCASSHSLVKTFHR